MFLSGVACGMCEEFGWMCGFVDKRPEDASG
jgi:hypothetical protein